LFRRPMAGAKGAKKDCVEKDKRERRDERGEAM